MNMTRLVANAYFGGAGGSSIGLHEAGFDVVGYDNWPVAVATHLANGLPAVVHDLSNHELDFQLRPCGLAWFSCPCQPFSAAGDGDGEFDGRDGFPWALRILAKQLPAVAIFENVKGLTFAKHKRYLGGIIKAIHDLGYEQQVRVLNCADYGVPQTRERCIIIARRDGAPIEWPTTTHTEQAGLFTKRWVSMATALGGADWSMGKNMGAGMVERHGERPVRGPDEPAFTIRAGGGSAPGGVVKVRVNNVTSTTNDYYRRDVDRPSPTIGTAAGNNWWVERPDADHTRLTIDELAALQDFPADWNWCGTKTDQARQIGNAVPRTLARLLAEANRPAVASRSAA